MAKTNAATAPPKPRTETNNWVIASLFSKFIVAPNRYCSARGKVSVVKINKTKATQSASPVLTSLGLLKAIRFLPSEFEHHETRIIKQDKAASSRRTPRRRPNS